MSTVAASSPGIDLDEQGRIVEDLPCLGCGYNLRAMRAEGGCAECGHPVPESIEGHRLAQWAWRRDVRHGVWWLAGGLVLRVANLVMGLTLLAYVVLEVTPLADPIMFYQRLSSKLNGFVLLALACFLLIRRFRWRPVGMISASMLVLLTLAVQLGADIHRWPLMNILARGGWALVVLTGIWLMTSSGPGLATAKQPRYVPILRWLSVLMVALEIGIGIRQTFFPSTAQVSPVQIATTVTLSTVLLAQLWLLALCLLDLVRRLPDPQLERWLRWGMIALVSGYCLGWGGSRVGPGLLSLVAGPGPDWQFLLGTIVPWVPFALAGLTVSVICLLLGRRLTVVPRRVAG